MIGDLHGVWGLRAEHGRTLSARDELNGSPKVTVLSHRFWTTRYGARPEIVGRDVVIDGQRRTIVGVLTADIELGNLAEIDVWLPHMGDPILASRAVRAWRPVGVLKDGSLITDADAQVAAIGARLAREYPDTNRDWMTRVGPTRDALGGPNLWLVLSLLSTAVGLLLLLACANIMNLLIARLISRRKELAVRTALGATRARIVGQIISESLVLGVAGGMLGLAVAATGLRAMHAIATEPFFQQVGLDVRVVLFATALSFVAPLAFAIAPALRVLRDDVRASLNDATGRSVGGATAARGRAALVVLQVSLAVTLLVVASLAVQSMRAVIRADLGYDPSKLLATEIEVPPWKVSDDAEALRLRQRLVERAREISGVQAVALATELPALHFTAPTVFDIAGRPTTASVRPSAGLTVISADYFQTLDVPVIAGRGFESADAHSPQPVVVVSQETARRYWNEPADAIGARISLPATDERPALNATVVGVARDTADPDLDRVRNPTMFILDEHRSTRTTHLVLRAEAPARLAGELRAAVRDVDPDLPTYRLRTVADGFADENSSIDPIENLRQA
ncbi:MAG: ABC transporter permease [Vicinamibacterales bacterium]